MSDDGYGLWGLAIVGTRTLVLFFIDNRRPNWGNWTLNGGAYASRRWP